MGEPDTGLSEAPRGTRSHPAIALTKLALLLVGIALLGGSALLTLDGLAHNRLAIDRLRSLRAERASVGAAGMPSRLPGEAPGSAAYPILPPAEEGALVGTLRVPRLDLEVAILEGTGNRTLRRGVGHIPGTALPGQDGNAGIAGHRDSFFRSLEGLQVGDRIEVDTLEGSFVYVADAVKIVDPEDVEVLDARPGRDRDLTLVTCYPFYYLGEAPLRYIIHAHLQEPETGAPGRVPAVDGWGQPER